MAAEGANVMVGKVVDLLFSAVKREIDYVRNCTENVDKLRNEAQKLKDMRGRVQQRIRIAEDKGDDLLHGVEEWVAKANAEISMVEEFLEQEANTNKTCFNLRFCVNLGTLYLYSKMATKKISSVLLLHENGQTYESCVSLPAPTPGFLQLYERKNLDDINTQKLTLGKIMEAIKDDSKQIIGIYGLGGVGKTTLAKEVAAAMKNLFADVVFTTASQNVNAEKIKKDVEVAAKRIVKGERILIIVDDVWKKLKLDEVGIPCGIDHMNCKILLTSRSRDVCMAMGAQSKICVNPLPKKEAWILFKSVAGERVETDAELKPVAREVAEECGGLPLIIQAVGKALENKSNDLWKVALSRLKNHDPMDMDQEIRTAFLQLELSYDFLESRDAKSCFLMCSMFPEDSCISLECLARYAVGLGKFRDLHSIEDARGRVRILISTLKSSFLLFDGENESEAKMHDIVRDVALLIASKGQNNFLVKAGIGLTEWRLDRDSSKNYTAISLMQNDIRKVPNHELDCPCLDMLLIQQNSYFSTVSDSFVRGMKEVKVLDMEHNRISFLPQSLALLTKLRMLNLGGNRSLKEISVLGELKDLEILILNDTGIREIPQQIGQLAYLRLLDVKGCHYLSHIAPGILSNLHGLEEFHIGYKSMQEGNYNSLEELNKLSRLAILNLFVPYLDLIPEDVHFGTLNGFMIQIGGRDNTLVFGWEVHSKRSLILQTPYLEIPLSRRIEKFIQVIDDLTLSSIENLNDIMPSLNNKGFNNLKSIEISECNNVSCLVDTRDWGQKQAFHSLERLRIYGLNKLSEICRGCLAEKSFIKLHKVFVSHCDTLRIIVSSDMPHVVRNITTLQVKFSRSVMCIFECKGIDGGKGVEMFLSKLEYLELIALPKLEVIWNCPVQLISLRNLVTVKVRKCLKLKRLFSTSVAQGLVHLQKLTIGGCDCLEEVIWAGDGETVRGEIEVAVQTANIMFPCLTQIFLYELPKLKSFCSGHTTIEYSSLVEVKITDCKRMEIWGYGFHHTPKLEYVMTGLYLDNYLPVNGLDGINDVLRKCFRDLNDVNEADENRSFAPNVGICNGS